jgi:hypothetical protein
MLYCAKFGGHESPYEIDELSYCAETTMLRILEMKGNTKGKNTNRFGERNFHMCMTPLSQESSSLALLAKDRLFFKDDFMEWSHIDAMFALSRKERGTLVAYDTSLDSTS